MIKTIYVKLTSSNICQRYGPHWEQVGFQGNDPSTDLRGCGILSLLLLIFMLESEYLIWLKKFTHFQKMKDTIFLFAWLVLI